MINRTTDRHRQFAINSEGVVTIQRPLDRETSARHDLEILAIDDGIPPRTATASLIVIVKDVNDNAPEFAQNYRPIVPENVPPRKIIELRAMDRDDAIRGNGPPFQFRLDPAADDVIRTKFKVEQNQSELHVIMYTLNHLVFPFMTPLALLSLSDGDFFLRKCFFKKLFNCYFTVACFTLWCRFLAFFFKDINSIPSLFIYICMEFQALQKAKKFIATKLFRFILLLESILLLFSMLVS